MHSFRFTICSLVVISTIRVMAHPPAVPADVEKKNAETATKLTREAAAKYEMQISGDDKPLVLRTEPILKWSNPESGQIYGNVFIWTRQGRPEVVGSLHKWFDPFTHMSHEFHSLARDGLTARYNGVKAWHSLKPGVSFDILPKSADVAATAPARLIQMRQLAREFTARSIDKQGGKHELRQLTQPAYRYELGPDDETLLDGALFAFVQGTDPEVWLMIEAQRADGKSTPKWHYAVARMNSIELSVEFAGQPVWHAEPLPGQSVYATHELPYTSFRVDRP
ncbi:MAG: hypothetical protein JSS49_11455 [Planctomycetes bacterium]|nr:hypothetical protein [Planctomycetota bacterium]